jgi:hypothetical protein
LIDLLLINVQRERESNISAIYRTRKKSIAYKSDIEMKEGMGQRVK